MLTSTTLDVIAAEYTFSSEKARKILNYKPAYTVAEAVMETVGYYRDLNTKQLIQK